MAPRTRALSLLARLATQQGCLSAVPASACSTAGILLPLEQVPQQQNWNSQSVVQRASLHYATQPQLPGPAHHARLGPRGMQPALQFQQTRGMFIQTQPTPNPHSLMFQPGQKVMESGSHEFSNARAGMASPLAKRLFSVDGVTAVFYGADFITVTKQEDSSWAVLKPLIFSAIMDHYASGAPLLSDAASLARDDTAIHEDDDEVVAMIKELLETRIRPAVQEDGGDITFRGFDDNTGVVTVKMMGACSGCPSSTVTLKSGIENMLMHYIPEVKGVIEAGPDEGETEGQKEFDKLDAALEGAAAAATAPQSSAATATTH